MLIRLLGQPAVMQKYGELKVLPRRVGEAVAVLATRRGQRTSTRQLPELLFPGVPPEKADWRTLLKKARKELPAGTLPDAYGGAARLIVEPDEVDCLRFADLVHKAEHEQGGARARLLLEALALWTDDVPFEGSELRCLDEERAKLERHRADAHCSLVEALIADHQLGVAWTHARSAPPECMDSERFLAALAALLAERGEMLELRSLIPGYEQRTAAPASRALREHVDRLLAEGFSSQKLQAIRMGPGVPRELPHGRAELTDRETELRVLVDRLSRRGGITVVYGQPKISVCVLVGVAARVEARLERRRIPWSRASVGDRRVHGHLVARLAQPVPASRLHADRRRDNGPVPGSRSSRLVVLRRCRVVAAVFPDVTFGMRASSWSRAGDQAEDGRRPRVLIRPDREVREAKGTAS
ncbi:hypothetical protein [Amycolatopsis sp. GA6-003]|uniref:hypothetical protein n=1 Tax=Amycolatopsis sp. GA6-003 TaxID=2652444 RepID=UPI003916D66F